MTTGIFASTGVTSATTELIAGKTGATSAVTAVIYDGTFATETTRMPDANGVTFAEISAICGLIVATSATTAETSAPTGEALDAITADAGSPVAQMAVNRHAWYLQRRLGFPAAVLRYRQSAR